MSDNEIHYINNTIVTEELFKRALSTSIKMHMALYLQLANGDWIDCRNNVMESLVDGLTMTVFNNAFKIVKESK